MRFLASGGKYWAAYTRPSAIPIAPSVAATQRFQRGWISGVPASVFPLNAKSSSTNFFERYGEAPESVCQRKYVFQSARDSETRSLSAALKKSGCQTFIGVSEGMFWSAK